MMTRARNASIVLRAYCAFGFGFATPRSDDRPREADVEEDEEEAFDEEVIEEAKPLEDTSPIRNEAPDEELFTDGVDTDMEGCEDDADGKVAPK